VGLKKLSRSGAPWENATGFGRSAGRPGTSRPA